MSALRISLPGYLQLIDQGPAHYQPPRGRGMGGHVVRPAPPIPRVKEPLTGRGTHRAQRGAAAPARRCALHRRRMIHTGCAPRPPQPGGAARQ